MQLRTETLCLRTEIPVNCICSPEEMSEISLAHAIICLRMVPQALLPLYSLQLFVLKVTRSTLPIPPLDGFALLLVPLNFISTSNKLTSVVARTFGIHLPGVFLDIYSLS